MPLIVVGLEWPLFDVLPTALPSVAMLIARAPVALLIWRTRA
jgi:hypothetical protein